MEPDLAQVLLERCQETLDEIEAALRLHDEGAYGACSTCGVAIPYERLEALPAASRCVSCLSNQAERRARPDDRGDLPKSYKFP